MENMITSQIKKIEVCDADYMGEYKLYHLFNHFTNIATENAMKINMWNKDMFYQYGWVIAKQTLTLHQPIKIDDVLELSTVIAKGSFVAFPRYYFIKKDGKEIGRCSSIWTLIDIKKRRIVSPKKIGINIPEVQHYFHLDTPKTISLDLPLHCVMKRQVLYSDIDTNQHMNNARYIEWALDTIDYQVYKKYFIKELSIHYKKEIRPLEFVKLYLGQDENRYIIEGQNENQESCFIIEIYFDKR
ncbi:MAG: hypothetical protein HFF37_03150 [Coprobacillus sp.]|nr:hypothetical protein [Coprobacillus sp.]